MFSNLWKFINAPIVILAIIGIGIYSVIRTSGYVGYLGSIEEGTPRTTQMGSGVGGQTYFGYINENKYASVVILKDVLAGPTWDISDSRPPLGPNEAVNAIRSSLSDLIPELPNLAVVNVNLAAVSPGGYYIYVVEFQPLGEKASVVGLRLIALMDGTVVRPTVSDE